MTPDMLRTLSRTWTHLCTKTLADLEPRAAVAILKDPVVAAVEARVNRLARTGDVLATQVACQAWNTAVKAAVGRLEEPAHAPRD
jgi:hypothetical protein